MTKTLLKANDKTTRSQAIYPLPIQNIEMPTSLELAINWLKQAQDQGGDDGVSYGYYLRGNPFRRQKFGWRESYVETSGYIIETFYDVAKRYNDEDCAIRAEKIGRWLLSVQNTDGSFSNANYKVKHGIVFDTGQVLFGLLRCYQETNNETFLRAAQRAAHWLASKIGDDGAWRQNTHHNTVHSYNARTAWAMLEFCQFSPDTDIQNAARANLKWVVGQQLGNGLFKHNSFKSGQADFTHTIAYAVRGLFEAGQLLGDQALLLASKKTAITIANYVEEDGFLPGRIAQGGRAHRGSACLTGNCQMAIIWYKMSEAFNLPSFMETADQCLGYALDKQSLTPYSPNLRGALKGSHPIWGKYTPLAYPNWATKFLCDAIMLKQEISSS